MTKESKINALEVLKKEFHKPFHLYSLCIFCDDILFLDKIDIEQFDFLKNVIKNERDRLNLQENEFFWSSVLPGPRIDFLQREINKIKNEK